MSFCVESITLLDIVDGVSPPVAGGSPRGIGSVGGELVVTLSSFSFLALLRKGLRPTKEKEEEEDEVCIYLYMRNRVHMLLRWKISSPLPFHLPRQPIFFLPTNAPNFYRSFICTNYLSLWIPSIISINMDTYIHIYMHICTYA
jgi:hypothetical protein